LFLPIAPWTTHGDIALLYSHFLHRTYCLGCPAWVGEFPVLTIHNGTDWLRISCTLNCTWCWFFSREHWQQSTAILVLLVEVPWAGLQRWPAGDWQVATVDVGQGDSTGHQSRQSPTQLIVIDAGPESAAEDKCLKVLGINHIPLLILSHFHADHVGGLSGLLDGRSVQQVWITNNLEPKVRK